jgi:excisionase family DNA binding protein
VTNRRPTRTNEPSGNVAVEDDLTRLLRTLARQAVLEAFNAIREALETPTSPTEAASDVVMPWAKSPVQTANEADQSMGRVGQFLPVAAAAKKLKVSEKTVRRKIATGELRAHRVGKLVRIGEPDLADYLAKTRLAKVDHK